VGQNYIIIFLSGDAAVWQILELYRIIFPAVEDCVDNFGILATHSTHPTPRPLADDEAHFSDDSVDESGISRRLKQCVKQVIFLFEF